MQISDDQIAALRELLRVDPEDYQIFKNGPPKNVARNLEYARRILWARKALDMDMSDEAATERMTNPE